jgi:hypothetical protein
MYRSTPEQSSLTLATDSNVDSSGSLSTPAATVADAEMDALLERVQVLVPYVSPEASARTVRMLRALHADAFEAHAVLRRARLRSEADGSSAEDESDLGEAVAELGFDEPDETGDSGDASEHGGSDSEGEAGSDTGSRPASPHTRDRQARRAYETRRLRASARQRSQALPTLRSNELTCRPCRDGGEIADGDCEAAQMMEQDDIQDVVNTDMPMIEGLEGEAVETARRSARHAMYKRYIGWKFADPLGAGKRKRIPDCCVWQIRCLFPDPRCGPECDLLSECERCGHYTGFRTSAESKAARDGVTLIDLRYHD